jgi:hypothetical protein
MMIGGLLSGNASAQWAVIDVVNIQTNTTGFAQQLAQTVQQYQQEVQQYQQLLMTVQGLGTNISLLSSNLQPITDASDLVQQNCPGAPGGSVIGTLMSTVTSAISPTQPITTSQQQICVQIVLVQIDKYNQTATVLGKLNTYSNSLQKLSQIANSVDSLGTTSGATTQATTYSSELATEMASWESNMRADDTIISSLQQQQSLLAKTALSGSNTILGNVVQAAALKAAFTLNN